MAIWICPVLNEVTTQSSWFETNAGPVKTVIQRHFYRTGRVREEISLRNGHRHGVARTWHKNGVLASEESYQNGVPHGICRQWDDSGRLLGKYKMDRGTGIQRDHKKDNTLTFEELGVDLLMVDEAHNFKNLFYLTKMTRSRPAADRQ
jgi:hypothetical protein